MHPQYAIGPESFQPNEVFMVMTRKALVLLFNCTINLNMFTVTLKN